jgi:hypothetical protein
MLARSRYIILYLSFKIPTSRYILVTSLYVVLVLTAPPLSITMAVMGLLVKAVGLGAIILITQYVFAYLQSPLKKIPGPFLAKFSNIWRFFNHYGQTHIETQRQLHEKHGDYVRLGPNTVSVADASLIKTIYNTRGTFVKSEFYR